MDEAAAAASRALSSSCLTTEHASVITKVEPIARTVLGGRAAIGMSNSSPYRLVSKLYGYMYFLLYYSTYVEVCQDKFKLAAENFALLLHQPQWLSTVRYTLNTDTFVS